MMLSKIQAKMAAVQDQLDNLGYPKINIKIEIMKLGKGCAGRAFYVKNKIGISSDYLQEFPDHIFNTTIAHEVVHLYVRKYIPSAKQHHGPEFRRLMRWIGLEGNTYHSLKLSTMKPSKPRTITRYLYITEKTERVVEVSARLHNKHIKGMGLVSRSTGESLKFTGKKIIK